MMSPSHTGLFVYTCTCNLEAICMPPFHDLEIATHSPVSETALHNLEMCRFCVWRI